MKVSRKWIEWAHTPPAESGVEASVKLCELVEGGLRSAVVEVNDPELVRELVSVAECYQRPVPGDSLYDMGPWWRGQPRKVITEGRAQLRAQQTPS